MPVLRFPFQREKVGENTSEQTHNYKLYGTCFKGKYDIVIENFGGKESINRSGKIYTKK